MSTTQQSNCPAPYPRGIEREADQQEKGNQSRFKHEQDGGNRTMSMFIIPGVQTGQEHISLEISLIPSQAYLLD